MKQYETFRTPGWPAKGDVVCASKKAWPTTGGGGASEPLRPSQQHDAAASTSNNNASPRLSFVPAKLGLRSFAAPSTNGYLHLLPLRPKNVPAMFAPLRFVRPTTVGIGLGCSLATGFSLLAASRMQPLRADAPRGGMHDKAQDAARSSARKAGLDLRVARQVSTGSIAGLVGGVALSVFSKPLTLLVGLLMLGAQYLESRGIHVVPYQRIQRYFKGIDVRSALVENVAFKLSFATVFTLAAFAEI